jgi:hypothetical protein
VRLPQGHHAKHDDDADQADAEADEDLDQGEAALSLRMALHGVGGGARPLM